ncbi:MAG TPA: ATP-binding protein [Dehalococcoidia bacterium]|nr:ATP-binding protein [Dehalococcoidia bacterium]
MATLRVRLALAYLVLVPPAAAAAAYAGARLGTNVGLFVALLAAAALVASMVLEWAIAREVTQPLERLRRAFAGLAGGSFTGAVAGGGASEVEDLVAAFNDMAGSLRQTMQRLHQARSSLEALLASSRDAIVALDAGGAVRYLNPAAIALYGSVEGRSFAEVARDPTVTSLLRSALPGRSAHNAAVERSGTAQVYIDHRDTWVQATASAIAGGGDWSVLVVLHDITEVRRAETTRRDFVANVSHELRTPLAGIKAVVETLRDGALEEKETAKLFLGQVDGEVDRLVQLVEELLQLARIESATALEMVQVRPREILAACLERYRPQAERAGVGLGLEAGSLPTIRANAAQLGQAVGNLVHNAIKFTPSGGRVAVSAHAVGAELRIAVADTGSGIDAADLPRIFERFYVGDRARSARGTGLGLAIVKHVVRVHDGSVEAQSTLGGGSTFTISLPLSAAPQHSAP